MSRRYSAAPVLIALTLAFTLPSSAIEISRNIPYGSVSGLALLMDVYHPVSANGVTIAYIPGTGWLLGTNLDDPTQKDARPGQIDAFVIPLVQRGYTVAVLSHRAIPRFRSRDALEDVIHAAHVIANGEIEGVGGDSVVLAGFSSGAHLAALATAKISEEEPDLIDGVIAISGTYDLTTESSSIVASLETSFVGAPLLPGDTTSDTYRAYQSASPVHWITGGHPPVLVLHGSNDDVLPPEQAELYAERLRSAGIEHRHRAIAGATHGTILEVHASVVVSVSGDWLASLFETKNDPVE